MQSLSILQKVLQFWQHISPQLQDAVQWDGSWIKASHFSSSKRMYTGWFMSNLGVSCDSIGFCKRMAPLTAATMPMRLDGCLDCFFCLFVSCLSFTWWACYFLELLMGFSFGYTESWEGLGRWGRAGVRVRGWDKSSKWLYIVVICLLWNFIKGGMRRWASRLRRICRVLVGSMTEHDFGYRYAFDSMAGSLLHFAPRILWSKQTGNGNLCLPCPWGCVSICMMDGQSRV